MFDEENLWKTINYYKNDVTRIDDVNKVLEFYEYYMNRIQFGEIGVFKMISKEWLNAPDTFDLIKQIATVNITYVQAFTYIKYKSYVDILTFANQYPRDSAYYSSHLINRMRSFFWNLIRNVKRACVQ